jgi:hypothetical protein
MNDARFEEMLNRYTGHCYAHANGCGSEIEDVIAARAALVAYFEERTAERDSARRELCETDRAAPALGTMKVAASRGWPDLYEEVPK